MCDGKSKFTLMTYIAKLIILNLFIYHNSGCYNKLCIVATAGKKLEFP